MVCLLLLCTNISGTKSAKTKKNRLKKNKKWCKMADFWHHYITQRMVKKFEA